MENLYLILAVIGFVLHYYFFLAFLSEYGFDLQLFFNHLFANQTPTFFVMDLIIANIVFYVFLFQESQRLDIGNGGFMSFSH
jgi:hypothetical protein